ncbi:hypothetical protein AB3M94_14285, partial [Peribacillus frigoritolerans]
FQLISEIRSLSADCLPSLLDASVSGVPLQSTLNRVVLKTTIFTKRANKKHTRWATNGMVETL